MEKLQIEDAMASTAYYFLMWREAIAYRPGLQKCGSYNQAANAWSQ